MMPNIGTLVMVVVLLLTVPSLAAPLRVPSATSTSTISYQGRLADSAGNPLTGKVSLEFRIYDVPTGGTPLWTEMWTGGNAVDVSDGLFNVMLGSIDNTLADSIEGHDELYLGITVGTDSEMEPRVQLGSVPFSMQAMTVPDRSITTAKIADGAVTQVKAPFAAEAHWGLGSAISQPGDIKTLGLTYVFRLEGGQVAEDVFYDISQLGFSDKPHAICQLVDGREGTEFCHCEWDELTNSSLHLRIRRYDGGDVHSGLRRVNVILFGR
jgi:hypothetical protein